MKVSYYIAEFLSKKGITDAFGIPGGVILDLIYAMEDVSGITPHLCYHEQSAAFAALGYAQSSGKLGVAYATRGPGISNMITGIADAFFDSTPVLFITAHSHNNYNSQIRTKMDQELNILPMTSGITKYAVRINDAEYVRYHLEKAYYLAMNGRKGPVLIDIYSPVLNEEIDLDECQPFVNSASDLFDDTEKATELICESVRKAKRPVILIGDGIKQSRTESDFTNLMQKCHIPVLSSRFSHDILADSALYYGYIGSHGMRCSNFILSKSDLVVSLGNRLSFPTHSGTYSQITKNTKFIQVDVDPTEFKKLIPNNITIKSNLSELMPRLAKNSFICNDDGNWINVCDKLRSELNALDINDAIIKISETMRSADCQSVIVCDVGNNEFWCSRAFVNAKIKNTVLYSKSFGALGCAIGKAIGAYYSTKKPVICFVGDQGFQMNIQELMYISQHKLPIIIVVLNNHSSGMIRSREKIRYDSKFLHTTKNSGYEVPDIKKIAHAYGIKYSDLPYICGTDVPVLSEFDIDENIGLEPTIPFGYACQDMYPFLSRSLYDKLNSL